MVTYTNCFIPIYNFNEILYNDEFRYLIKGYDPDDNKISELSNKEINKFAEIFDIILNEYSELNINSSVIADFKKRILINILEAQLKISTDILNLYAKHEDFNVLAVLEPFGYNFKEETVNEDIENVIKKLKGLSNQIRIHKVNHSNKLKNKSNKNRINLHKEALQFESILELGYSLNPMTTSTYKWIELGKRYEQTIKARENGSN